MRKWGPLAAICLGSFMLILDTTVVTVALPEMARGLGASLASLQWVVNSYTLVLAVLALSAGAIGDLAGQRRVFVGSVTVFAVASLGCALAPNAGVLIGARAVQGVGGAAMMVAAMSLLGAHYEGKDRGSALGIWTAVLGGAGATGPFLGGVLTQWAGWQAIFFLNLPLSAATLLLTSKYLVEAPKRPSGTRIDLGGMVAFGASSGALVYGLIEADDRLPMFILATAALVVFVMVERRVRHPMLDLALFRRASFVTVLIVVVASSSVFACLIYASIWLQSVQRLSPAAAGLALIPLAATSFVTSLVIGKRLPAVSPGIILGLGALLAAAGCALEWAMLDSTWLSLLPGLIVTGAGMGIAGPAGSTAILSAVPRDRAGMASGAMATFRQLGQTLGVAVLGLVYASTADLGDVFLVTAGLSLVAAVLSVLTRNSAGARSRTRGSSAAAGR